MNTKKKILIFIPHHFELPNRFKENLENLNFEVFVAPNVDKNKISFLDNCIHIYKKLIKKDKTHKRITKNKIYHSFLTKITHCDYGLVIRPDMISDSIINNICKKSEYTVSYQWDGLERFPVKKEIISKFNRFFVFDQNDTTNHPDCIPITNFYFDDLIDFSIQPQWDIFFIGTYMKDRINDFLELTDFFTRKNYNYFFYISGKNKRKKTFEKYPQIHFSKKGLTFKENLLHLRNSKILLDFKNNAHEGLSFRIFESIGFKKKLITTNELVKQKDFYHKNNIFVFKNNNFSELEEFLELPYYELPEEIYKKYSFTNWIHYVLNIPPFIKI